MHCENFARIAKINPCENFAMHFFTLSLRNFAIIAKMTVHSENLNFAMPCIFAMIAKFTA